MRNFNAFCFALIVALAGCSGANSQLTTCQSEKEQLLATIRGQRETERTLETQVTSLEQRLDQSEKELARGLTGTRISSRPAEATNSTSAASSPKSNVTPVPTKAAPTRPSDALPWRAPAIKSESALPAVEKTRASTRTSSAASLAALARRDSRVQYDAKSEAARVDVPLAFDRQTATLTGEDKRQLDEVAKLLKTSEAKELRVMVAGTATAERAKAVADYLDRHGIAQERLAVSATKGKDKVGAAGSGVEIYLLDPETTVVGWEPGKALRR